MNETTAVATFDPRIIESWTVENLLQRLEYAIGQLDCASPTQTLANVHTLPPQEATQIWEWNATVPRRVERCVHSIIEEQAQNTQTRPLYLRGTAS